jgi:hypothetical protein
LKDDELIRRTRQLITRADLDKAEAKLPGAIDFAVIADARQIILNETTTTRAN